MTMDIKHIPELELDLGLQQQIAALRNQCFPEHAVPRSYYKQLPHFRSLIFENHCLLAHVALDYRVIAVNGAPRRVLGIIDLCVDPKARGRGLGGALLNSVIKLGQGRMVDFLLLAADDHRLYLDHGFQALSADCHWLRIDEFKNYGVARERLEKVLMIRKLGEKEWPEGPVDMLGYLY